MENLQNIGGEKLLEIKKEVYNEESETQYVYNCDGNRQIIKTEDELIIEFSDSENGSSSNIENDDKINANGPNKNTLTANHNDKEYYLNLEPVLFSNECVVSKKPTIFKFECDQCGYRAKTKYMLRNHLDLHEGNRKFSCDQCSYTCTLFMYLQKHKKTHVGFNPYACNKCDFTCKTMYSLREHRSRHTSTHQFKCSECDYSTTLLSYLKRHTAVHDVNKKTMICDFCDYRCRWNCQMQVHLLSHSGERPFACDVCGFVCKTKAHLKQHSKTHKTDGKLYACDVCSYKGASITYLKRHKLVHTGDKFFECTKCTYKTNYSYNLKKHSKIHEKHKSSNDVIENS